MSGVGEAIRGRFPVFRDKVYVNSCSQGALSDAVRAAYEEYLDGWDENGAEWEHWVERSEAARAAFAELLGAAPDDVAIQTSVSAAVSGLVSALQFRGERNRIVISANEFPTIGQIAHAQELRGAEVVQVEPDPEAYAAAIDERTALVCSTFVSFRTGAVHDVEAIYGLAREHGALMLVDGYQGIGAVPLEAAKAGDVVVGGTVKYLLASAGLAFMALRPGLVEELVPVQTGWFADENVFDMQIERYRPHRSARRFDAGTPPVPNIYAGVAGVGLIREVGVPGDPGARPRPRCAARGRTGRARRDSRDPAAWAACLRPLDGRARARGRARRGRHRRFGARLEPSRLAPSLQHRGRHRRRPRRAGAQPPPDPLAFPASGEGGIMSRELSRNQRRLAAIAAFGVFWGAFLVTIGFSLLLVVIVVGGLVGAAAIGLQGRRAAPRCAWAGTQVAGRARAAEAATLRALRMQRHLVSRGSTGKGCASPPADALNRRRGPGDTLLRLPAGSRRRVPSVSSPPAAQL